MVSTAEGWKDGARSWSIAHDAQEGIFDISADGELPDHFEAIKDELFARQNAEGGEDAELGRISTARQSEVEQLSTLSKNLETQQNRDEESARRLPCFCR